MPDIQDNYILNLFKERDEVELLKLLEGKKIKPGRFIKDGNTSSALIHYAAHRGLNKVIQYLIDQGVSVDVLNSKKSTPLHYAAAAGQLDSAEKLIKLKAKVNAQNNIGETPLHNAVREDRYYMIGALLDNGADHKIRNNVGNNTPFQVGYTDDTKDFLLSYMHATGKSYSDKESNRVVAFKEQFPKYKNKDPEFIMGALLCLGLNSKNIRDLSALALSCRDPYKMFVSSDTTLPLSEELCNKIFSSLAGSQKGKKLDTILKTTNVIKKDQASLAQTR